jgi:hypothetical protein
MRPLETNLNLLYEILEHKTVNYKNELTVFCIVILYTTTLIIKENVE